MDGGKSKVCLQKEPSTVLSSAAGMQSLGQSVRSACFVFFRSLFVLFVRFCPSFLILIAFLAARNINKRSGQELRSCWGTSCRLGNHGPP